MATISIIGTFKVQGQDFDYEAEFEVFPGRIPTVTIPHNATQISGSVTGPANEQVRLNETDQAGDIKRSRIFTVGDFM